MNSTLRCGFEGRLRVRYFPYTPHPTPYTRVCAADALCGFQGPAANEDGKPRQQLAFGRGKQVVAPTDRSFHGCLPGYRSARPIRQNAKELVETARQLIQRERLDARGSKLDRQRNAVEARADSHDGAGVLRSDVEPRLNQAGAFDE